MASMSMPAPPAQGLYDPAFEHDACGVAFVAQLSGEASHDIVAKGLTALENLDHRGATGADAAAGDGAGMLLQVPDAFLREVVDFELPQAGHYAMGMAFLPTSPVKRATAKRTIEYIAVEEGLEVLGWRVVPTRSETLSPISRDVMPQFEQLFVRPAEVDASGIDLDRMAYPLRQRARNEAGVYFASLSARTTVYKGMLTTQQLAEVYPDLSDERMASALVLVHSRFSTNTFPAWELSHPYRLIAHNGEINTVRGNRNWMRAREALLATDKISGDLERIFPICTPGGSDSASFDEVLELLHLGGRSLPHAVLMMIPEAWENHTEMDEARRAFYSFHSSVMEPWDGPAAVTFTDGSLIGATLDRNGLRPGRYWVTDDGLVVFASEAGVLDLPVASVIQKGRLQPGRMLLVDLDQHRLIDDDEIKATLAAEHPYAEWLDEGRVDLNDLPDRQHVVHSHASVTRRQQVFGYTHEELKLILAPMANSGYEPIGSMGSDTPLAVLSERPRLLFDYFTQLFAQVTNPPLDAIREELVTSLRATFGPEGNLLQPGPDACRQIVINYPILDSDQLAKLVRINRDGSMPAFDTHVVRGLYDVEGGGEALRERLAELCEQVSEAIARGCRTLILSDRHSNAEFAPIPSLLLTAAIHHHLVREKKRTQVGLIVEAGVLDIPSSQVVAKGRLQPGRMLLVDMQDHRLIDDDEIKSALAAEHPYAEWLEAGRVDLDDLPERQHVVHSHASVTRRQQVFGYTHEELQMIVAPMANTGAEPIGSMGTDSPVAILSDRPRLLFDYFAQLFAQVTNPPLDAIREELVTSLRATFGPEGNLLNPGPESCRQIVIGYPILDSDQLAKLVRINRDGSMPAYDTHVVRGLYDVEGGGEALKARLDELCDATSEAIARGCRTIILSDRHSTAELAPIPSLLLTAAVHHHLVREKTRSQVGLLVEAGDIREVHHVALLIGYGAAAVNPYLLFESAEDLARREVFVTVDPEKAVKNVRKALGKGVLKVMSKMGVSTIASYTGAEIFEALGLSSELVAKYFSGTTSRVEGVGLDILAEEIAERHAKAYPSDDRRLPHRPLEVGGEYKWRREGPPHLFDPETIFRLQHSTRTGRYDIFKQYTQRVNDHSERLMTLRSLLRFSEAQPIPIEEVEPVSEIVKRFSTGAMSYGSISREAHETLAIAMNRIGARSNTGEGGEDRDRLYDPERRSAIKQVASGRFGVTSEYLANGTDIQIKMAQGAKPGEGGQLPGPKVYPWVAKTRHSTPGVGLISPPPHHDIYSIEDIKQLIHDLKCANPAARVHVKLVAEVGVGTVAAGVSKAKADVVLISGHDGGTGAAPLTSLKHAGGPWELGLAETQQTLRLNGLRDRIVVQVDGQLKTGRDVVISALLGAEEFGFATAPLVTTGCVMMRVCHLDTCPVGVATQNPELRAKFAGHADYVVNFMEFIAEEVREILASLGLRSIDEAVGRVDLLGTEDAVTHWKAKGLDLSPVLSDPAVPAGTPRHCVVEQDHGLKDKLDVKLIELARPAIEDGTPVQATLDVRNVDRTVGTMLGYEVTKATRGEGLEPNTIYFTLEGTGGQSFGAFVPRGITLRLIGDTNDYFGKGLSGGRLIVVPSPDAQFKAEEQIIAGNVIAYGATAGELFIRGRVGERFCVRNSGVVAVVEGVGDHACEYMTGGEVLIIGQTGRNIAAGMSGGLAYVLDLDLGRLNTEMVDPVELSRTDVLRVRELLEQHLVETGSPVAEALLATSDEQLTARVTKLVPRDYARILRAREDAEKAGLDEAATTQKMMEAAHG